MLDRKIFEEVLDKVEKAEDENRVPKQLVKVRFEGGLTLTYFSDLSELGVGDVVSVDGEMEDQIAVVTEVLTSFKKPKYDMKWVASKIDNDMTGEYFRLEDDVVSLDCRLSVDKFMNIYAGSKYKENIAVGEDDIELDLAELEDSELFDDEGVKSRGRVLYKSNAVQFISLKDGVGKAVVRSASGDDWYEIDFRCKEGKITYLACDCPYFGQCKHLYAFLLKLKNFYKKFSKKYETENFVLCRKQCFNYMMSYAKGKVVITL